MRIVRAGPTAVGDWVELRRALWPSASEAEHEAETAALLAGEPAAVAFLARDGAGVAVAFAEVALRVDHVNGCLTRPVAFLKGIYVREGWRRQGVARRLCAAVEAWAREQGCAELASDADLANTASHRMHESLGFAETERVVFYRRVLRET